MAPIKITVEGVGVKLSTDAELDKWLEKKNMPCLIDSDGDQIVGFESLVERGVYTLGPSQQKTPSRLPQHPNSVGPLSEMERVLKEIYETIVQNDRATPIDTPAHVGNSEKRRLLSENRFNDFRGNAGEKSVLSTKQLKALSATQNEHQIVAYLTPFLEDIVKETASSAVFNSEEYKWIETSSKTTIYNEKPDLIVCHPALVDSKPPFECDTDPKLQDMRRSEDRFGVLSKWKLRDFIGLTCEAKQCVGNGGFGEVINYGKHICFGKGGAVATRLILFDKKEFWLIDTIKGTVSNVLTCGWTVEGSRRLLYDFVRQPPLVKVLCKACEAFRLKVGTDSFLGAGAFGYVFRAQHVNGREIALKVMVKDGTNKAVQRLETERIRMDEAKNRCPDHVMGVEEDGFKEFEEGVVLLLSNVGEHYSKLAPQDIFDSLTVLHDNDILHGDARLENVVCVDGKPVWIDFAESAFVFGKMSSDEERGLLSQSIQQKFNYTPVEGCSHLQLLTKIHTKRGKQTYHQHHYHEGPLSGYSAL